MTQIISLTHYRIRKQAQNDNDTLDMESESAIDLLLHEFKRERAETQAIKDAITRSLAEFAHSMKMKYYDLYMEKNPL